MPPAPKPTDNLDKIRHLMGTRPDHEIAEMAGSTISVVGRYRRRHGISAYDGYKFGVGQTPPARKGEGSEGRPTKKGGRVYASKLDPYRDLVGKIPDGELADKAGMSTEGVRMYRRRHKIPMTLEARESATKRGPKSPRKARPSKLDPFRDLLGTVPDREVAAMAGVTAENVRAFRRKRGIPAGWRGEDAGTTETPAQVAPPPAAPAAAPAVTRRPASGGEGYEVEVRDATGGTRQYITIAGSLVEAAELSQDAVTRAGKGATIVAIKHLGPALT